MARLAKNEMLSFKEGKMFQIRIVLRIQLHTHSEGTDTEEYKLECILCSDYFVLDTSQVACLLSRLG